MNDKRKRKLKIYLIELADIVVFIAILLIVFFLLYKKREQLESLYQIGDDGWRNVRDLYEFYTRIIGSVFVFFAVCSIFFIRLAMKRLTGNVKRKLFALAIFSIAFIALVIILLVFSQNAENLKWLNFVAIFMPLAGFSINLYIGHVQGENDWATVELPNNDGPVETRME